MTAIVPLLTTKFHAPPAYAEPVSRLRLTSRLSQGLMRPLTLVVAPAGYGKTTLVREWLKEANAAPSAVAWLSLDDEDDEPVRFLTYLIAALRTLHTGIGETALSLLQSPQPPALKTIMTLLINDLAALTGNELAPGHGYVLVLDDYHVVTVSQLHEAMAFLVDHLPPHMHLLITGRSEPPLPLSRWRARNRLAEVRTDDLRFTLDETAAFLRRTMGLSLSAEQIATLGSRTEGWVAGLQLAALSLQGHEDTPSFIHTFSGAHQFVMEYLVDEVVRRQPPEVQPFLLQTAILSRLSSSLCDAVTGGQDGQTLLRQVEQANLFLVPLDEERRWYRYHPLFADALNARLRETSPDLLPELHRRASLWHEQNGLLNEAITHALTAGDSLRAAQLVEQSSMTMIARGEASILLRWLQALPANLLQTSPRLCTALALVHMITGHFDQIEPALQQAESAIARADNGPAGQSSLSLLHEITAIRVLVAIEQDTPASNIGLAQRALANLPPENLFLRSALAYSVGIAHQANGETRAAAQTLTEAKSLSLANGNLLTALLANYELAEVAIEQGALRRAQALHQDAMQLVTQRFGERGAAMWPLAGSIHIGLGKLHYEWNDLAKARHHLETGIALAQQADGLGMARHGLLALAWVCQARGDEEGARHLLEQAERRALNSPRSDAIARLQPHKARLWLAQGNLDAAWRWLETNPIEPGRLPAYQLEINAITAARVYLTQPKPAHLARAAAYLAQARSSAEAQGRVGCLISILAVQALVFHTRREPERALAALQRSLKLAEPEGHLRTFVDEGALLYRLLGQWLADLPAYAQVILQAFAQEQEVARAEPRRLHPVPSLVEPLTERELAVLRLLVVGYSNQEIAQHLVIAEGTVKKYTHNIFGKLGVDRRTQAMKRAVELGLVDS